MSKINLKNIGRVTMKGCELVIKGVTYVLTVLSIVDTVDKVRFKGEATYSDAVEATMDCSMFSFGKQEIMRILPRNKDSDFYKAVIEVVHSDMFTSNKVDVIRSMCENVN